MDKLLNIFIFPNNPRIKLVLYLPYILTRSKSFPWNSNIPDLIGKDIYRIIMVINIE